MGTKGEATKDKIIRAARRLFRQQGYTKTSIDDICRESGVTRGNLYFYFKSKEELAQFAIDDSTRRHIPFFQTLMEDEPDSVRKVELLIDGIVGYYAARGSMASCLFGNIAQEVGESNTVLAEAANRFFVAWAGMLTDLFDEAKATGSLKPEADSTALSYLLISSIEGALILHKASKSSEIFAEIGEALKLVIKSLRQ